MFGMSKNGLQMRNSPDYNRHESVKLHEFMVPVPNGISVILQDAKINMESFKEDYDKWKTNQNE